MLDWVSRMNWGAHLFDHACDLSDKNGFSGNQLKRLGEECDAVDLKRLRSSPKARFYVVVGQDQLVKSLEPFQATFLGTELTALDISYDQSFFLGLGADGEGEFALGLASREHFGPSARLIDLRAVGRSGRLQNQTLGALAQARSLVLWHLKNPFCSGCGGHTRVTESGYSRRCTTCKRTHFPRTDPVVIMLAVHDGCCLLGRGSSFPEKLVSALAGFVEVGETVEEAVRREIFEETGIVCGRVRYRSSQTWPFPSSLMIGCFVQALSTAITLDHELAFAGWFSRREVRALLENRDQQGLKAPPKTAIARQLIDEFAYS